MVKIRFSLLIFVLLLLMILSFSESKPAIQQITLPQICRKTSDCLKITHKCVTVLSGYGYCINMDPVQMKKSHEGVDEMSVENYLPLKPMNEKVPNADQADEFYDASFAVNSSTLVGNGDHKIKKTDRDTYAPMKFTNMGHDTHSRKTKTDNDRLTKREDFRKTFENWNSVDDINQMHIQDLNDEEDDGDVITQQVLFNLMRQVDRSDSIKTIELDEENEEEDIFDNSE